jgi:hypothetical protein
VKLSACVAAQANSARARIWAVGGGGGGGIDNYSSTVFNTPRDGDNGEDTLLSLSATYTTNTLTCGGGKGGVGANWGTSLGSYSNGTPGEGGVLKQNFNDPRILLMTTFNGIKPVIDSRSVRQPGGGAVFENTLPYNYDGHGGFGVVGVGDEKWSYGGGGGSGAGANLLFSNNSSSDVPMYYRIGALGKGRVLPAADTNGKSGGDGAGGFILVEFERL